MDESAFTKNAWRVTSGQRFSLNRFLLDADFNLMGSWFIAKVYGPLGDLS